MIIAPFNEVDAVAWDGVADGSSQAWFYHRAAWVRIESEILGLDHHSFAVLGPQHRCMAIVPLYLYQVGRGFWIERLLSSGYHRHAGPAILDDLPPKLAKEAVKVIMHTILAIAVRLDVDRIHLGTHNLAPGNRHSRLAEIPFWVKEYQFKLGMGMGPMGDENAPGLATLAADQIIDLEVDQQTLFDRMDKGCREAVRQAERFGLIAVQAESDPVEAYLAMAQVSAQRTGEQLASIDYFKNIWHGFAGTGRCAVLFIEDAGRQVGAVWLLIDKGAVNEVATASLPEYLPRRVNNLLRWQGMLWAKRQGYRAYRIGPIFPELPSDWPVSRVSRFKGDFGGDSYTIIQGSRYLRPWRYRQAGIAAIRRLCGEDPRPLAPATEDTPGLELAKALNLILATYGFLGQPVELAGDQADYRITAYPGADQVYGLLFTPANGLPVPWPASRLETPGELLVKPGSGWFGKEQPEYRPLLPYLSYQPDAHWQPLMTLPGGERWVMARSDRARQSALLVGCDVVEEFIRYRQGDPDRLTADVSRSCLGFDFERPFFLYEHQLVPGRRSTPWADRLGFAMAENLARLTGLPLVEPLPNGRRGLVILTGDDDQAYLEKYQQQLQMIGDMPITYFLHPLTKHTRETLQALPKQVELALHPDALETPDDYDRLCEEQSQWIHHLLGHPVRMVRNHGYLSSGYWGHLAAWEKNGLELDVNVPGVDGTALNGSFLPMRVRRPDGLWSDHLTLLTAFGDGMIYALNMSQSQSVLAMARLATQIERTNPGVMVCNFHPQNMDKTGRLHQALAGIARRKGWQAMGLQAFLDWWRIRETLQMTYTPGGVILHTSAQATVSGLVLRFPVAGGWHRVALEPWQGTIQVNHP